jgi:hypothetical protein
MTTSIPQAETKNVPATATPKTQVAKRHPQAARRKAKPARMVPRAKKPVTTRGGSKTAQILDLLKRPGGATLKELMKATGWQAHSVRGFLSGALKKKMRTPVESLKKGDGDRTYRISK